MGTRDTKRLTKALCDAGISNPQTVAMAAALLEECGIERALEFVGFVEEYIYQLEGKAEVET